MKKNYKIILVIIAGILVLVLGGKLIYDTYIVSPEEKIDRYNFKQLEKFKEVIKDIPEEEMKFRDLGELNRKYDADIEPIKNCYYAVTTNFFDDYEGESSYIFGFQLESDKYRKKYGGEHYAYPKYDLSERVKCFPGPFTGSNKGGEGVCKDMTRSYFNGVTSNPCRD